jgi:hypothetical protein
VCVLFVVPGFMHCTIHHVTFTSTALDTFDNS